MKVKEKVGVPKFACIFSEKADISIYTFQDNVTFLYKTMVWKNGGILKDLYLATRVEAINKHIELNAEFCYKAELSLLKY